MTTDGGNQSPLFSQDGTVDQLKAGTIVRITLVGGGGTVVQSAAGVSKFVGFGRDAGDEVIVLLEHALAGSPLGVLSLKSGTITPIPFDPRSEAER